MRISEVARKQMFSTESILHDIVVVVMSLNGPVKDEWEYYHGNVRIDVALWGTERCLSLNVLWLPDEGSAKKDALRLVWWSAPQVGTEYTRVLAY
jgi:hypothetical protein